MSFFNRLEPFMANYKYGLILAGIVIIYTFNLMIDVMDVDASQYASISMEMAKTNSYLEVYNRGFDYLDKPPLLFWLSSISMKIFGFNNVAYKLPSVLLALLGIFSTFQFAKIYYKKEVAIFAAIILGTTQALFLITNDIRTDTNLLVFVIFSVWQLTLFVQRNSIWNFLLGFTGIALAMLAKGPIGIIAISIALGTDFILKKEWRNIFNWRWIIGLIWVAILLAPMTYGLYHQFDLHPEKSAYGIDSPSGIRFFYWTQSFGRITGESEWDNGAGFFFFFHSILWDFQPWILYLILGIGSTIAVIFRNGISKQKEFVTIGGFIITFIALSFSRYKLPHYIFVTFPFAAIIAANYLVHMKAKWPLYFQGILNLLFWILCVVGLVWVFPIQNWWLPSVLILLFIASCYLFFRKTSIPHRLFFATVTTIIGFNLLLASHFYPNLVGTYQSTSVAGKLARAEGKKADEFFWCEKYCHSTDFYFQEFTQPAYVAGLVDLKKGDWVYTNKVGRDYIHDNNLQFKKVHTLPNFSVTSLSIPFLFESTRGNVVDTMYIFEKR